MLSIIHKAFNENANTSDVSLNELNCAYSYELHKYIHTHVRKYTKKFNCNDLWMIGLYFAFIHF